MSRLLLAKRLKNSKPLSVRTHSTRIPLCVYHFTGRFKKSVEKQAGCSGQAARKRCREHSSIAVHWNRRSSGSVMRL